MASMVAGQRFWRLQLIQLMIDDDVFDFTGTDGVETEDAKDSGLASSARTTVDGNGPEEGLGAIVSC